MAYAEHLKDKMLRARICFQWTPYRDRNERLIVHQRLFATIFFPYLLMVLRWMSEFEDAKLAVLDICVYTKIDCLHGRGPLFTGEAHQRAQHDLDGILRVALRSIQNNRRPCHSRSHNVQTQPDATSLCRSIRSFDTRVCYCEHPFAHGASGVPHDYANRGCIRVNTAVALDLLERHA
jgi:hypothetical protein